MGTSVCICSGHCVTLSMDMSVCVCICHCDTVSICGAVCVTVSICDTMLICVIVSLCQGVTVKPILPHVLLINNREQLNMYNEIDCISLCFNNALSEIVTLPVVPSPLLYFRKLTKATSPAQSINTTIEMIRITCKHYMVTYCPPIDEYIPPTPDPSLSSGYFRIPAW